METGLFSYWPLFALAALAYIIGSVPTAVWAGKWLRGVDLREHGSGNAGATNAIRVLGPGIGFSVLLIDALKGVAAISLASVVKEYFTGEAPFVVFQIILGAMAILGHVFPLFASFRGGKGIATLVGISLILFREAFLICLAVFLIVFLVTRYVSMGSLAAAIVLPFAVIIIRDLSILPKIIFAVSIAIFVPLTHLNNIKRLLQGKENRISFRRQKS